MTPLPPLATGLIIQTRTCAKNMCVLTWNTWPLERISSPIPSHLTGPSASYTQTVHRQSCLRQLLSAITRFITHQAGKVVLLPLPCAYVTSVWVHVKKLKIAPGILTRGRHMLQNFFTRGRHLVAFLLGQYFCSCGWSTVAVDASCEVAGSIPRWVSAQPEGHILKVFLKVVLFRNIQKIRDYIQWRS